MEMTEIILIITVALLLGLTLMTFSILGQIKSLRDQIHFIARNDTNKRITFYGKSRHMVSIAKDINEILDSYNERDAEIIREDKEIKDTLTNMSHDIRTPLTSMKGYFELMGETNDPEEQAKYRSIISERIDSLAELLETMFYYTKVSNVNYKVTLEKMNFSAVVLQTMFSYFEEFEKLGITPDINAKEDINIIGNEQAVKRILQNLIKNVLIHGDKDVKITLFEGSGANEGKAVFTISNREKPGDIPDPTKVFDRFYKADKSRHTASSGIGLSVVKKLVLSMGGTIEATSEKGIFTIVMMLPTTGKL